MRDVVVGVCVDATSMCYCGKKEPNQSLTGVFFRFGNIPRSRDSSCGQALSFMSEGSFQRQVLIGGILSLINTTISGEDTVLGVVAHPVPHCPRGQATGTHISPF
jgi:hypothetical protein